MQRNLRQSRSKMLLMLACLAITLLFFFEWLGSEQPQHWVESPLATPPEGGAGTK